MNKLFSIFIIGAIFLSGLMPLMNVKATSVYYGNFQFVTLLETNGLITKWSCYNNSITTDRVYRGIDVAYILASTFNLKIYDTIIFEMNGIDSKSQSIINVMCPDGSNYYQYYIFDLHNGHYNYSMPITSYTHKIGSPDDTNYLRTASDKYQFGGIYLKSSIHYEIYDGSALKYQGLINPNINDFITVTPPPTVANNDWFYLLMLLLVFVLSAVAYKYVLLVFPAIVLDLWLVINNSYYTTMILLYVIIILLSLTMCIASLLKKE